METLIDKSGVSLADVKWSDADTVTFPPDALPAKTRDRCVFAPTCSSTHEGSDTNCARCGEVGDANCIKSRIPKRYSGRFLPLDHDGRWICPMCCFFGR
eukprot:TRINITY_DN31053_c0_g1_i1.p1 TRINITY_DN31053_c0_g1~~TRINITY_DN31053_c0_g1_i1.p1  ORF type:complete len:109 (-),score=5.47 TRINITY_DN31053_c0_g1_i1:147-443(-)